MSFFSRVVFLLIFFNENSTFLDTESEVKRDRNKLNIKTMIFPRILDAHDSDYSAGVSEDTFRAIFYICPHCGRYMTQRISSKHHEDEDFDFDSTFFCAYLNKSRQPADRPLRDRLLEPFPFLSPLYTQS